MAKQQPNTEFRKRHVSVIRDAEGNPIADMISETVTNMDAHGNTIIESVTDSRQLACGLVTNFSRSLAAKAELPIGVCSVCRSPQSLWETPSNGLCSQEAGSQCATCGAFLCPKHAHLCKDGKYRCKKHALDNTIGRSIKTALKFIFFKSEE